MKLLRSGLIVALCTLLSRIFGLMRELCIAAIFGVSEIADAVNVAFKLPNLFRRIFGEGALSSVFIPFFSSKLQQSPEQAKYFSGSVFSLLILVLVILIIIMEISMPYLMYIIAPGFHHDIAKFELTVLLCRITMPYLLFISLVALLGGMLNSVNRFGAFAFSPILLNIVVIFGTLLSSDTVHGAWTVSLCLSLAGFLQILFMIYFIRKANLSFSLNKDWNDKDMKMLLGRMVPATLSSGVAQLNLFISQSLASFIPGAVSVLAYADRIYQLPLSLIGVTFGTILLPELSKMYEKQNFDKAALLQNKSVQIGVLCSAPCAVGIMLLSYPITYVLYERGAFNSADTGKTAEVIFAFALGLPAFTISKVLLPIFYANKDTKTPLRITLYSLTVNTVLNILLMSPLQHLGIAIGSSIASWYSVWLSYKYAKSYNLSLFNRDNIRCYAKIGLACKIMAIVVIPLKLYFDPYIYGESQLLKVASLLFVISVGAFVFGVSTVLLKLHHLFMKNNENTTG